MIYKRFRESEDLVVRAIVDEDGICRLPEDYYDDENLRSEIKKIIVPKDAIEIEEEAFSYCENLESVVLPEGLDIIGDNAFDECPNLKNVVIPSSVTKIGPYAFFGCGLESVKVPAGVTEIEDGCFGSCMDLVNIEIPEGVTSIGDAALARIKAESVHLPSTVKFIYEKAFDDCKNLVDINIPKSVTYIGAYAFHGCTKLNELVVPADCEVEEQDLSRNQHGEHIINIIRESGRVSPRRFREDMEGARLKDVAGALEVLVDIAGNIPRLLRIGARDDENFSGSDFYQTAKTFKGMMDDLQSDMRGNYFVEVVTNDLPAIVNFLDKNPDFIEIIQDPGEKTIQDAVACLKKAL